MNDEESLNKLVEELTTTFRTTDYPSGVSQWRTMATPEPRGHRLRWIARPFGGSVWAATGTGVAVVALVVAGFFVATSNHKPVRGNPPVATAIVSQSPHVSYSPNGSHPDSASPAAPGAVPGATPTTAPGSVPVQPPQNSSGVSSASANAWGDNSSGDVGDGSCVQKNSPVAMKLGTGAVKQVAGGATNSVVLKSDGTVWVTGRGTEGEMGNGLSPAEQCSPTQADINNVVSIAAGQYTIYAVKSDGTVWSWGFNGYGELGDGTGPGSPTSESPVQVVGLSHVVSVTAERFTAAALKSDGTVWTWGENDDGELGNDTRCMPSTGCQGSDVPVQVHGPGNSGFLTGIVMISGGRDHTLALRSDGTVWGWGADNYGQLGDNNSPSSKLVPVEMIAPNGVSALTGVTAIAGGGTFSLVLQSDGTVLATGDNSSGELGDNEKVGNTDVPVPVSDVTGVSEIAAGYEHALVVERNGSVWSWGSNTSGQLGIGSSGGQKGLPVQVTSLTHVNAVSAGQTSSLALG